MTLAKVQGADAQSVNRKDEDGRTALHWAAANKPRPGKKHAECVELLLHRGAKVNTHDDGGWTPFMSACSAGNQETMRLLIKAQASADACRRLCPRSCTALLVTQIWTQL